MGLWPTDLEDPLMAKGRHRAGHAAGHHRTSASVRKAAPGARKAPPEARRASPTRVGGARVEGRRLADGGGRPAVLTALGSGEKLFALVPLAILSVASVAGLAANGGDDPAASPSPVDAGTPAAPVGHQSASRLVPTGATPTSARPSISDTEAPVVVGEDTSPETVDEEREPVDDESTAARPRVDPPAEPTNSPAETEPSPGPSASPTTTNGDVLTRAEATVRCLQSGISTLDVVALAACVDELLG